ncbi:MAG: arsenate reductase ArsC [Candidatus Hodarchaeales archaeon]
MLTEKKVVLFICTHNSARSQLAEAILKQKFGNYFETFSAGTFPTRMNPFVKQILVEMGISTSKLKSKNVNEFLDQQIDLIVTVCDSAKETCPIFPGAKKYEHMSFKDPSQFTGSNSEILNAVRQLRDEISEWIERKFAPKQIKP